MEIENSDLKCINLNNQTFKLAPITLNNTQNDYSLQTTIKLK